MKTMLIPLFDILHSAPFSLESLLVASILTFLELLILSFRLRLLFPKESRPSICQTSAAYFRGQFLNHMTITGLGDAYKVQSLRQQSTNPLSAGQRVSIILTDKVFEGGTLVLIAILGGAISLKSLELQSNSFYLAFLVLVIAGIAIGTRLALRESLLKILARMKERLAFGLPLKVIFYALAASFLAWGFELGAILILCSRFHLSFIQGTVVLTALNLGTLLPVSPAKLGIFEGAMTLGLTQVGVPLASAIAIATAAHILLIFTIVAGASLSLLIWRDPQMESDLKYFHRFQHFFKFRRTRSRKGRL